MDKTTAVQSTSASRATAVSLSYCTEQCRLELDTATRTISSVITYINSVTINSNINMYWYLQGAELR